MWLEEVLRVFTRLTAIKPLLQNHFVTILKRIHQVLKIIVHLGGRFHTPELDNIIKLPYLRTTPWTQKQKGQKRYSI